jgi:uncharacterized protein CbrC (UPF0167 family)
VCRLKRGYVYDGLPYADQEYERCICPWCIADGSAADQLRATFNDPDGDEWNNVPGTVVDEILHRTPGFTGWQQERWLAHCDDAMVFLGPMGYEELRAVGQEAARAVTEEFRVEGWSPGEIDRYVESLERDGEPTAYVFRCRRCRMIRGYSDFT